MKGSRIAIEQIANQVWGYRFILAGGPEKPPQTWSFFSQRTRTIMPRFLALSPCPVTMKAFDILAVVDEHAFLERP